MEAGNQTSRVWIAAAVVAVTATACGRSAAVQTTGALPLRRVVVYRNGVGYFERQGEVQSSEVRFQVQQREVGDFLATLSVMERGGSTVRAAAFPMPEARAGDETPPPDQRRTVRLALDGARHDLTVGYTVETPIWRPSYRLIFAGDTVQVQAWGIVQNLSGEDWHDVRLSLVAGAPVSFRSELAQAVVPRRPVVTDQGAVIDAVPGAETTLAEIEAPASESAPNDEGGRGTRHSDTGQGGGGTGDGTIGLGSVGVIGHGAGSGVGQGYGSGGGELRERGAGRPTVRAGAETVQGPLSHEVIRRVVLRNLGQVNRCYAQGLAASPNIAGRMSVRFVIGGTGAVTGSEVVYNGLGVASVGGCIAASVRRWQFPAPAGGGTVTVTFPFFMTPGAEAPARRVLQLSEMAVMSRDEAGEDAPSAAPRNASALAALAVQGGTTRYDLPNTVTIPDRSATMVMLAAREVPGARMYLFAPDLGVPASASHPFHVARFENRTGALLERGPVAIFEAGAFLGQGMLDALPDAATTTIPFAVERALAVEHSDARAVEGARLVSMHRDAITLERFNVTRTTWRVRNGMDHPARVLLRQPLEDAQLFEPPAGTEESNGNALVPVEAPARGRIEQVVTTRAPFTVQTSLRDEQAADAIAAYLRDASPAAEVAAALRTALDLRRQMIDAEAQRADLERRRDDLQRSAEETRENLTSIQRNAQAADLRARLTQRLGRVATELDQLTRRIVEIDTQLGERRVRLVEAVQGIDLDTSRPAGGAAR